MSGGRPSWRERLRTWVAGVRSQLRRGLPILRDMFRLYRANFWILLGAGAIVVAFAALAETTADAALARWLGSDPLASVVLALLAGGVHGLGYNFLKGVVTVGAMQVRAGGGRFSLWGVARTLPWLPLLAVDLIVTTGTAIGTALLVIPGVLVAVYFALAPVLIEVEKRGVRSSLRRSAELVRGSFWLVAAVVIGVYTLVWAIDELYANLGPDLGGLRVFDETLFDDSVVAFLVGAALKPFGALGVVLVTFELLDRERARASGERRFVRRGT